MFPITVAIAAPAAPKPSTEIKIGSRMIFTTEPNTVPAMDAVANPSVLSRLDGVSATIINGAPRAIKV